MQAGITPAEAKELLRLHRETYRPFWRWSEDVVSSAMLTSKMRTVFGWRRVITAHLVIAKRTPSGETAWGLPILRPLWLTARRNKWVSLDPCPAVLLKA